MGLAPIIVISRVFVHENALAVARIRGALIMTLLAFLTSCTTKDFVRDENGFVEINEATPAGEFKIKVIGESKKVGERQWVTGAPWKLVMVLNATLPADVKGCTVRAENLSLLSENESEAENGSEPEVVWEPLQSDIYLRNAKDKHPSAILITSAKQFEHKNYRLLVSLAFDGECAQALANHKIEVPFTSFSKQNRSSLWDNLMGI